MRNACMEHFAISRIFWNKITKSLFCKFCSNNGTSRGWPFGDCRHYCNSNFSSLTLFLSVNVEESNKYRTCPWKLKFYIYHHSSYLHKSFRETTYIFQQFFYRSNNMSRIFVVGKWRFSQKKGVMWCPIKYRSTTTPCSI